MEYGGTKKAAEDLERKAKVLAERAYQKERFSHTPVAEMDAWYKKTFDRYRQAAEMWTKAGKPKKAVEMYNKSIKYAPSGKVENKVKEQIRNLENGRGRLERNLFASVSIVSLIASLFLISVNLTGNSVGNLKGSNLSLLGIGLFILGLTTFIFFKARKK